MNPPPLPKPSTQTKVVIQKSKCYYNWIYILVNKKLFDEVIS